MMRLPKVSAAVFGGGQALLSYGMEPGQSSKQIHGDSGAGVDSHTIDAEGNYIGDTDLLDDEFSPETPEPEDTSTTATMFQEKPARSSSIGDTDLDDEFFPETPEPDTSATATMFQEKQARSSSGVKDGEQDASGPVVPDYTELIWDNVSCKKLRECGQHCLGKEKPKPPIPGTANPADKGNWQPDSDASNPLGGWCADPETRWDDSRFCLTRPIPASSNLRLTRSTGDPSALHWTTKTPLTSDYKKQMVDTLQALYPELKEVRGLRNKHNCAQPNGHSGYQTCCVMRTCKFPVGLLLNDQGELKPIQPPTCANPPERPWYYAAPCSFEGTRTPANTYENRNFGYCRFDFSEGGLNTWLGYEGAAHDQVPSWVLKNIGIGTRWPIGQPTCCGPRSWTGDDEAACVPNVEELQAAGIPMSKTIEDACNGLLTEDACANSPILIEFGKTTGPSVDGLGNPVRQCLWNWKFECRTRERHANYDDRQAKNCKNYLTHATCDGECVWTNTYECDQHKNEQACKTHHEGQDEQVCYWRAKRENAQGGLGRCV